jgi:hypothetical protein
VQSPLAARLVLEVFHCVGDEGGGPFDPSFCDRTIKQPTGRADERFAGDVFLVARLFAHQHQGRAPRARARHRLGGILVERAAPAGVFRRAQRGQRGERRSGIVFRCSTMRHRGPVLAKTRAQGPGSDHSRT